MLKHFIQYIQTPLSFMRINLNNLKLSYIGNWMRRKISEVSNRINGITKIRWNRLLRVRLIQQKINFFC